jgi:hypothetical protein
MSFIDPVMSEAFQGQNSAQWLAGGGPSATSIVPSVGQLDAPVSMGGASAGNMLGPLSMASTAMGAIGPMIQGIMGFVGGQQQAKQAKAAAAQASLQAGSNVQEGLIRSASTVGRAATLAAASGGGLGGSTTGVINQLAERGMFNARVAAYKGATQADADLYMAKVDKDNATNSLIQGFGGSATAAVAGGLKQNFRDSILQSKAYQSGAIDPYAASQLF